MIGYAIFVGSMAVSIICVSYDAMARSKGWPVGDLLSRPDSLPKITALVTALWVIGKSFFLWSWWSPALILIIAWIAAFILTMSLKKYAQVVAIVGIFPALLFAILYVSEDRPLGMLHRIFT